VLFGAGLTMAVAMIPPLPLAAKLPLGVLLPLAVLAVAAHVPAKAACWRRFPRDTPARYQAQSTPGNVRERFADGLLAVALSILPPGWTGRGGDSLEMERAAWVRVGRRLKAARAQAAFTVEMVPDEPPQPGWEVPGDLPLPSGAARFGAANPPTADRPRSSLTRFGQRPGRARAPTKRPLMRFTGDERAGVHVDEEQAGQRLSRLDGRLYGGTIPRPALAGCA